MLEVTTGQDTTGPCNTAEKLVQCHKHYTMEKVWLKLQKNYDTKETRERKKDGKKETEVQRMQSPESRQCTEINKQSEDENTNKPMVGIYFLLYSLDAS